jgi:hypothetical protein
MAHPLDGPRAKIERAKEHLGELETRICAFMATGPYEVGARRGQRPRAAPVKSRMSFTPLWKSTGRPPCQEASPVPPPSADADRTEGA